MRGVRWRVLPLVLLLLEVASTSDSPDRTPDPWALSKRLQAPLDAQILVINMAKSEERRERLLAKLSRHAQNLSIIEAMEAAPQAQGFSVKQPNGPSHVQWQGHWPPGGCPHIAEGEHSHIANTMSHLLAIHAAWHAGKEVAMILEDDMAFLQWPSQRLMYSAPPGWEVLQLYSLSPTLQPLLDQPPSLWLAWSHDFWSASAYIINRAGMHKVLSQYAPASLNTSAVTEVDFSGGPVCNAEGLVFNSARSFTCTDLFVYEEDGVSTIHHDETHAELHHRARKHVELLWSHRGTLN